MDLTNATDSTEFDDYVVDEEQIKVAKHYIIGIYLTIVGILGTVGNSLIIATFIRFRNLITKSHALLVNLCVAELGICIFGLPFAAVSSFANRWLFGDGGCQYYALMGFIFGTGCIATLTMLSVDRYLIICQKSFNTSSNRYKSMLVAVWIFAVFWGVMPMLGWGRYGFEPSSTTCTIDYRHNDIAYKSYLIMYTIFSFVVPIVVMAVCYYKAATHVRSKGEGRSSDKVVDWADEDNITKLCILLVFTFVACWSAYAVVCLWTVFWTPESVPDTLALMPPLLAKASTVINPFLYVYVNKRLRRAVIAVALCKKLEPFHEFLESQETARMTISPLETSYKKGQLKGDDF